MTKEELIRCHNTAERWRILQRKMNDTRERARCAKVIRYQDEPKGRGEPISSMQSYVEKLEQLQEELKACECALHPLQCKITKEIAHLPFPQNYLISEYYVYGFTWDTVNARCGLNRNQSQYYVRKALKKILEKA